MKRILFTILAVLSLQWTAMAQVDTINAKNNKLQLQNLREGNTDYLVYFADSLGKRNGGDLWQRDVKFTTFKNQPTVTFTWTWLRNDSVFAKIVNICDRRTLAPIYRHGNYKARGIFAFNYQDGVMVPADSIANNAAVKKGKVDLTIPIISWELDLETYPLLPIKKVGQKFDISFFDPNEKAPTYHRYEVVGKEALQLNHDVKVNCWLLKINYASGNTATFWLTEKSKEVVKMVEKFGGRYRIKVRQY